MSASSKKTQHPTNRGKGKFNARYAALNVLQAVLVKGRSLATARSLVYDTLKEPRERSLAMELVNGVLRWRFKLEAVLARLVNKPLRKKDRDVEYVLLLALYELIELSTPEYAVVNEAVAQTRRIGKKWASGMVNGVLRNYIRDRQDIMVAVEANPVARFSHPQWLIELIENDWPEHVQQILEANNRRPPMWLRVNLAKVPVEDYIKQLDTQRIKAARHPLAPAALMLDLPLDVSLLPGFCAGQVSVQDAAAQLAAELLEVGNGERVLDLCAAPGGKTCHVLETAPDIKMTAVELDPVRMQKVQQNLDRLGLRAHLIVGDAGDATNWWDGQLYDRVLVDAPCSASGVIRRHPDIKSLRQAGDLDSLTAIQQQILRQAWRMLRPGGVLLYVTCSVLRAENEQQIERLRATLTDAEEVMIEQSWGVACRYGRQLLPGQLDGDGFFFARLKKQQTPE